MFDDYSILFYFKDHPWKTTTSSTSTAFTGGGESASTATMSTTTNDCRAFCSLSTKTTWCCYWTLVTLPTNRSTKNSLRTSSDIIRVTISFFPTDLLSVESFKTLIDDHHRRIYLFSTINLMHEFRKNLSTKESLVLILWLTFNVMDRKSIHGNTIQDMLI